MDTAPVLGSYVEDHRGTRGRVVQVHHFCPMSESWIAVQSVPVTNEERRQHWYSVLCEPAGSVVVPAARLAVVEPFEFTNPYRAMYFGGA